MNHAEVLSNVTICATPMSVLASKNRLFSDVVKLTSLVQPAL